MTGFLEVIKAVYENTTAVNTDIRSATIKYWLLASVAKTDTDRNRLVRRLIEVPEFMSELVLTYEARHNGSKKTCSFTCQHCRKMKREQSQT